ncbi:MAG: antA/AntB antirepressor family protein [Deltaproteobacteria bacterium]|nr:antA/AntB antirepressor family protein [Deltaproteobacteria bacterium]
METKDSVEDHFSTWITRSVDKYKFISNVDYLQVLRESAKNPLGGRPNRLSSPISLVIDN